MTYNDETLLARIEELEHKYTRSERRQGVKGSLAVLMCIGAMIISPGNKAIAQGYGESLRQLISDVSTLKTEMSSVQNKTQFMSVSGSTTFFTACNVQIDNGLGSTDGIFLPVSPFLSETVYKTNGLGNLIIGYNQTNGQPETGSHNLILGDENGYTSFGGIVAGYNNLITGPNDSITGGSGNQADGYFSSVTGGESSLADNEGASVSGGNNNVASAIDSSVSGGIQNEASGTYSSLSGGSLNLASGTDCAVSGGQFNTAFGLNSAISGGYGNKATGGASSVSGGNSSEALGEFSSVAAGVDNLSVGLGSSCLGGYLCRSDDPYSAVLGGDNSTLNTGNECSHYP